MQRLLNPWSKIPLNLILTLSLVFLSTIIMAQRPSGGQRPMGGREMPKGRFYGKVVDDKGKGVAYAAVQLYGMKFDTVAKKPMESLLAGQITAENGDFSLEDIPVRGEFTLKVSFLGYGDTEQKVSFGTPGSFDKDLGNILLSTDASVLDEVVVTGEATNVSLALDKKVFRVDKDASATGGTAEDALKNVPSLSVDLDGNLTLRNASPQLFVDGRPTTLTLDQIPADAIETVEVITNPSAKYDASGGQAGIVNIVMKKDRRLGYNGSVRGGFDTRGALNGGGNINVREGKLNVFLSAFANQRISKGTSETDRQNFFGNPQTNLLQDSKNNMNGYFTNLRGGFDWFVDNRNTLTISGSYTRGNFNPENTLKITTDSLFSNRTGQSTSIRNTTNERSFTNIGGSVLFKHLFPKEGKEWTADINFNQVSFGGFGDFRTEFVDRNLESRERQESDSKSSFVTIQADYVDPLTKNVKLEAGVRASVRDNNNQNMSSVYNAASDSYVRVTNFADVYNYEDAVYAAYATLSYQTKKWGYLVGLRAESSSYTGVLPDNEVTFENDYPLSLFPSVFVTHKLNDQDNIQLSYTRRINRPNFFQLMPFTDFSDSLNIRRGNANLLPEFTNSLEFTYQNIFNKGNNLLVSAYYKQATDLITSYQFTEFDAALDREVIVTSYTNSNSSLAYGVEFTLRNALTKKIELTTNINAYNSRVDASNVEADLIINQFSWFIKENLQMRLPKEFMLQISGEYRSRAAFTPSSGGSRFGGHRFGSTNTAQGYSLDNYFVDVSVRKSLFKRKLSLTVSIRDILKTRRRGTYTETDLFIQRTFGNRDPQVARVTLSYRFGKPDISLFKRKNNKVSSNGMDMMQ